jgi:hypothetical protein
MQQRDLAVRDLTVTKVARFFRYGTWPRHIRQGDAAGPKAFFELLCRKGLVATPVNHVTQTAIEKLHNDFSLYLRQERLLAPTTVANYLFFTKKFLAHRFGTGLINLYIALAVLLHKLWVSGEVYEPLRNNHKVLSAVA